MAKAKLFACIITFLLLVAVPLFSIDVVLNWECNDPTITALRVQRVQKDGKGPEEWIELPADTTSYTFTDVDQNSRATFRLQSTKDGGTWKDESIQTVVPNVQKLDRSSATVGAGSIPLTYGLSYIPKNGQDDDNKDENCPRYIRFRLNNGPWYTLDGFVSTITLMVDEDTARLANEVEGGAVLQVKASNNGRNWSERYTSYDPENRYNEAYMAHEGWVVNAGASIQYPYLVAFFTPAKGTVKYRSPKNFTSDSLKVSFNAEVGAVYETANGNGFGLKGLFVYSPTQNDEPYTTTALELAYSRLLYKTPKENGFQLRLETGIGPAFCKYGRIGSLGFVASLGVSCRIGLGDDIGLFACADTTAVVEPNFNGDNQLTLATTMYASLPFRVGLSYSFKEVKD